SPVRFHSRSSENGAPTEGTGLFCLIAEPRGFGWVLTACRLPVPPPADPHEKTLKPRAVPSKAWGFPISSDVSPYSAGFFDPLMARRGFAFIGSMAVTIPE